MFYKDCGKQPIGHLGMIYIWEVWVMLLWLYYEMTKYKYTLEYILALGICFSVLYMLGKYSPTDLHLQSPIDLNSYLSQLDTLTI